MVLGCMPNNNKINCIFHMHNKYVNFCKQTVELLFKTTTNHKMNNFQMIFIKVVPSRFGARALIGGGGGRGVYSYIYVLPDWLLLK